MFMYVRTCARMYVCIYIYIYLHKCTFYLCMGANFVI
jgi:hypothetical protein